MEFNLTFIIGSMFGSTCSIIFLFCGQYIGSLAHKYYSIQHKNDLSTPRSTREIECTNQYPEYLSFFDLSDQTCVARNKGDRIRCSRTVKRQDILPTLWTMLKEDPSTRPAWEIVLRQIARCHLCDAHQVQLENIYGAWRGELDNIYHGINNVQQGDVLDDSLVTMEHAGKSDIIEEIPEDSQARSIPVQFSVPTSPRALPTSSIAVQRHCEKSIAEAWAEILTSRMPLDFKSSDPTPLPQPTSDQCVAIDVPEWDFRPYEPKKKLNLRQVIQRKLMATERTPGYIYLLRRADDVSYVKVGVTASPRARIAVHEHCNSDFDKTYIISKKVDNAKRVEALIHADLAVKRYYETRCKHGSTVCSTAHKEWFKVNFDHAKEVVDYWVRWMKDIQPYQEGILKCDVLWRMYEDSNVAIGSEPSFLCDSGGKFWHKAGTISDIQSISDEDSEDGAQDVMEVSVQAHRKRSISRTLTPQRSRSGGLGPSQQKISPEPFDSPTPGRVASVLTPDATPERPTLDENDLVVPKRAGNENRQRTMRNASLPSRLGQSTSLGTTPRKSPRESPSNRGKGAKPSIGPKAKSADHIKTTSTNRSSRPTKSRRSISDGYSVMVNKHSSDDNPYWSDEVNGLQYPKVDFKSAPSVNKNGRALIQNDEQIVSNRIEDIYELEEDTHESADGAGSGVGAGKRVKQRRADLLDADQRDENNDSEFNEFDDNSDEDSVGGSPA